MTEMAFDINRIRADFPILSRQVYKKPLVYLDNGATTQKPRQVIDCINEYHTFRNSSIHRGVHFLSEQATEDYENARKTVCGFLNARHPHEIIFTSGTTASINGIATSFSAALLKPGDEILVTEMEHHANIVPWQMACDRTGSVLRVLPFNDAGELCLHLLDDMLSNRTRLVALTHVSNALGTVNPVNQIIQKAHDRGIPVLVDGAQSVQHLGINLQEMECDFFVFSAHKTYGPTGLGILYGREEWLEKLPPFAGGGEMVDVVTFEKTTYNVLPHKFEAGTPNYIGAIGLAEALKYLQKAGLDNIARHEHSLLVYGTDRLSELGYVTFVGEAAEKSAILSFNLLNVHPYDAGMILDKMGIAVRTGTHCAQPVMQHFGIPGTIRASLACYNTREEIDLLVSAIEQAHRMLS